MTIIRKTRIEYTMRRRYERHTELIVIEDVEGARGFAFEDVHDEAPDDPGIGRPRVQGNAQRNEFPRAGGDIERGHVSDG